MILKADNISFSYKKGKKILDHFSIEMEHTERVGLLAPSGFGKTTLCQLLAGYQKPDEGKILLDGHPLPDKGVCPVQMIWQHPELVVNPRLRMRETLAEGDHVDGRILHELGIEEDWLNRYPGELSGGEIQRFCIARALGESTRFLIADEITTMLDLITQSQIWRFLLNEVREKGIGLLAVSHNDDLIERITSRVVKL